MIHAFQKLQRNRSWTLLLLACLLWVWAFSGSNRLVAETSNPTPGPSVVSGPKAVLTEFYHWYLGSVAQHHDPLSDKPAQVGQYVSKKLLQQIEQLSNSPEGLDEDYFMKSQDILEDWPTNIVVSEVRMKDKSASAIVTLGATKDSKHALRLNLILEGTSWKISKVH